jgi:hypothetical protein
MGTYRAYNKYDLSCLVGTDIVAKTTAADSPIRHAIQKRWIFNVNMLLSGNVHSKINRNVY